MINLKSLIDTMKVWAAARENLYNPETRMKYLAGFGINIHPEGS